MIEHLRIRNFKSIIEDDIKFSDFTVLVGANGSGKSNLIQALSFLSSIPRIGVVATVNRFGGFSSVVPKAIARTELAKARVFIHHKASLPPLLEPYGKGLSVTVEHELELAGSRKEVVRVAGEKIVFHGILEVPEALGHDSDEESSSGISHSSPSKFVLERGPRGGVHYSTDPQVTKETLPGYLEWLGLAFLEGSVNSASGLNRVLDSLGSIRRQKDKKRQRYESFLDPDVPRIVEYAQHFIMFRSILSSMKVYDLLLSALRYERPVSESDQLSSEGSNMPSVVRRIRSSPDAEVSLGRIMNTLGEIAPHVTTMKSSSLRTGKEFVEFTESFVNRSVESWESSDGTLRALAILLALETHPRSSTILIEEPEQNLHPWAITAIIKHIREVIKERGVQVIITTHSPQVLEQLHAEEVLVATRTEGVGTKFRTLEEILPHSRIAMGEVADLWVKGLLGGVPSYE